MPRKKCEKKNFEVQVCRTKIYKRCPNWTGPKPRKPRAPKSAKAESVAEIMFKKPMPSSDEKKDKWIFQEVHNDSGHKRLGPIQITRFPPFTLKKFPHKWNVIQEGKEHR